jgi:large subunit ribosomal protein L3
MAGRMGGQQHTVQNLKVLHIEPELGVVVVNGECSGPNSDDTFLQFCRCC